jgi:hypothetical protein
MIIVDGLIALFLNANFEKILPILGITCLITFLRLSMKVSHFIDKIYYKASLEEKEDNLNKEESK